MGKNITRLATVLAALVLTVAGSVALAGSANADVPGTAFRSIRNNAWGQCAGSAGTAGGTHVSLNTCDSASSRNWVKVPTGQANTFYFVHKLSGLCLTAPSNSAGQVITIDVCSASPTQSWVQLPDLKLLHLGTGLCLDTVGGPGSELMQWFCGQEAPVGVQSWIINP
jgi:hypothetical protein